MNDLKFLETFVAGKGLNSRGHLGLMICLTRNFINDGLPADDSELVAGSGGQVRGVSGAKARKVLKEYGIERALASEAGRTTRGSIALAREYVQLLRDHEATAPDDLKVVEGWWIEQVKMYFAREPFTFKYDASKTLRSIVKDLLAQAMARQSEDAGTMYCGIMLEHLVGAKLELIFGPDVEHHSASSADQNSQRNGDFEIGDVTIHVTTSPSEALVVKCKRNLDSKKIPMIITMYGSVTHAETLCRQRGIEGRVEVFDAEQFLVSNLYEHGAFSSDGCRSTSEDIIGRYNKIIDEVEGNPSLRIDAG